MSDFFRWDDASASMSNEVKSPSELAAPAAPVPKKTAPAAKPVYEAVWCSPLTRTLVRHAPKPAIFNEFSFARAFTKLVNCVNCEFMIVCRGPVDDGETKTQHAKSLDAAIAPNAIVAHCKWVVVGRSPDDYTVVHRICEGGEFLTYVNRADALVTVEFLKRFPNSLRPDLIIDVVPWTPEMKWRDGYAMATNEFM
jgi:ribosomal protein S26